jgi:hypothetical protein
VTAASREEALAQADAAAESVRFHVAGPLAHIAK